VGAKARDAIPKLEELLNDDLVRQAAAEALGKIKQASKIKALNDVPKDVDKVGIAMSVKSVEGQIRALKLLIRASQGRPFAERISTGEEVRARHFLGVILFREGEFESSQNIFKAGLVDLWDKMPKEYREAKENAETIETLKAEYLQSWAKLGLIAAKREKAEKGEAFDGTKIKMWKSWHVKLGMRAEAPAVVPPRPKE
jgi:hypothetical protein